MRIAVYLRDGDVVGRRQIDGLGDERHPEVRHVLHFSDGFRFRQHFGPINRCVAHLDRGLVNTARQHICYHLENIHMS